MGADGQGGGLDVPRLDVDGPALVPKALGVQRPQYQGPRQEHHRQDGEPAAHMQFFLHGRSLLSHVPETVVTSSWVDVSNRMSISSPPPLSYSLAVTSSRLAISSVK